MTKHSPTSGPPLSLADILVEEAELLDGPFPDDHSVKVLARKNTDGTLDNEVIEELRRYIHGRHPKQAGLCISGVAYGVRPSG